MPPLKIYPYYITFYLSAPLENQGLLWYYILCMIMCRDVAQLVARLVRDEEAASSNLVIPTIKTQLIYLSCVFSFGFPTILVLWNS